MKKSQARIGSAWERRNCDQASPVRRGAGSIPAFFRISHTVDAATFDSQPGQFPVDPAVSPSGVLPGQPENQGLDVPAGHRPAGLAAHGPRRPAAADDVAVPAHDRVRGDQKPQPLAPRFRYHAEQGREQGPVRPVQQLGRRGCRRCRTASWWRRIKISAVFHASSRRDSRSHAASRVIRRNTNRRHMTGDHHGRSAERATLLVRTADGILGTHRPVGVAQLTDDLRRPGRTSQARVHSFEPSRAHQAKRYGGGTLRSLSSGTAVCRSACTRIRRISLRCGRSALTLIFPGKDPGTYRGRRRDELHSWRTRALRPD